MSNANLPPVEETMFDLADRLKDLKDHKKQKELELRNIGDVIFQVETALAQLMAMKETQNFTRNDTTFCLMSSTKASAIAGSKEEFYANLRQQGYGDLIYETINANSLSSFIKEQISENENSLPDWLDGLVNVYEKTSVGVRKSTKS